LHKEQEAEFILYVECKYRDPRSGEINSLLRAFVQRVYEVFKTAGTDDVAEARFCFVASVPPSEWRDFLRNRTSYCRSIVSASPNPVDNELLERLATGMNVLVLPREIVSGEGAWG
jgi:hypothetical protein